MKEVHRAKATTIQRSERLMQVRRATRLPPLAGLASRRHTADVGEKSRI
jgi:hypothetical protein